MTTVPIAALPILIVGAGRLGRHHGRILAGNVAEARLAGVVEPDDAARPRACAELEVPGYATLTEGLDQSDARAVVVASPPQAHAESILESADRGLPVFCEKPMTFDLAEAETIDRAVTKAGTGLQIGHMRRYDRAFARLADAVARGEVGRVKLARCATMTHGRPPTFSLAEPSGVGIVTELAIHDIDALEWILDDRLATLRVTVEEPRAEDEGWFQVARLHGRTVGGTVFDIVNLWPTWQGHDVRVELVGSEGRGWVDDHAGGGTSQRDPRPRSWADRFELAYIRQMEGFVASARTGATFWPGLAAALRGVQFIEAARESVRRGGGEVDIPP